MICVWIYRKFLFQFLSAQAYHKQLQAIFDIRQDNLNSIAKLQEKKYILNFCPLLIPDFLPNNLSSQQSHPHKHPKQLVFSPVPGVEGNRKAICWFLFVSVILFCIASRRDSRLQEKNSNFWFSLEKRAILITSTKGILSLSQAQSE